MLYFLRIAFWPIVGLIVSLFEYIFRRDEFYRIVDFIIANPLKVLFWLVSAYFVLKFSIKLIRWLHLARASKHYVFLRITLPRADSKADQEKRTEKDVKEKIAIMEQLYRAVNEIKELNLWNLIHVWIWQDDIVSFEMYLKNNELNFYVVCAPYFRNIIEKQITAFYPNADINVEEPYHMYRKGYHMNGFYLYTTQKYWFPIKQYKVIENDPLNDVANALSKLQRDDEAAVQVIVNPTATERWRKVAEKMGEKMFRREKSFFLDNIPIIGSLFSLIGAIFTGSTEGMGSNAPGASGGDSYVRMLQTREEVAKRIGEKAGQIGFDTSIRIMAASKDRKHVVDILNNLVVSFNVYRDAYSNWFQNRRIIPIDAINSPLMHYAFTRRLCGFLHRTSLLVPSELTSIFHFPDSRYNPMPIIKWLKYKVLPAPIDLPTEGVVIGNNVHRGIKREVKIMKKDRTRHMYIIGKSGSGKSVLLSYMARQDIINGDGTCVVDPHGDLIEEVLQFIPKERAKDVIVFDPSDTSRPMGLNLLEAKTSEEKDRASLDAMSIFIKLFGDEIFGPRIQHYFRNGCLTLMDDEEEGATLIDVPRLFVDEDFQKYKVAKIKNPVVRAFWENEMAKTGAREKEEMIPYFSSKFGPFITNTTMRNIIGQPKSAFNIRQIMDDRKILLVNLSKGKIGDINAQLLGLIFVNKINMAAMSRVDQPEGERNDFYLYVDEFQNFATDAIATILSEARKYRLALIMAHQYIAQLTKTPTGHDDTRIRDAVFGNVGTMMSFKVGADDAEYLAKEYAPTLSEQDILGIANYKAYIKLNINNTTSRPFSLETIYDLSAANPKISDIVKKYSRLKYGRKKDFVDQEVCARVGIPIGNAGEPEGE